MTTPLISITLPTFFVLVPFSAMGLLKRGYRGAATEEPQPPAKRAESNRRPSCTVTVPGPQPVILERLRHPGGMVESSAVRRDRRRENRHGRSVVAVEGALLRRADAEAALPGADSLLGLQVRQPRRAQQRVALGVRA